MLGFQCCTDTITFLMATKQHWVMNYLDDIIGESYMRVADEVFFTLKNLLQALSIPVNSNIFYKDAS